MPTCWPFFNPDHNRGCDDLALPIDLIFDSPHVGEGIHLEATTRESWQGLNRPTDFMDKAARKLISKKRVRMQSNDGFRGCSEFPGG